jgi:hypothetical protein
MQPDTELQNKRGQILLANSVDRDNDRWKIASGCEEGK